VHDWPSEATTDIPSPRLVAAWLVLDTLPTERIPLWAAHWLAGGCDGEALAELAGLHGDDPVAVRDLLPHALIECGVPGVDLDHGDMSRRRAVAMTAFTAVARLCLDGLATERWVVSKVVEIVELDFDTSIIDLPLGRLLGVEDEWSAGWGRTEQQLRADVRRACEEQLRAAQSHD
jgi:hypothetical protein